MTMKNLLILMLLVFFFNSGNSQSQEWKAKRITAIEVQNESNTWIDFVKEIDLALVPPKAITKIACDSKYWMWINGKMVVFEGQLKRGPTPYDTYYDDVDIAPFLKKGKNTIAILVWYFGKDGFSHNSSGEAGLVFECDALNLISDEEWYSRLDKAFEPTGPPNPNYRLSESNVKFDARIGNFDWVKPDEKLKKFGKSNVIGEAESAPWNKLVKRPTPQWKNYGIRLYENQDSIPAKSTGNWIVCKLPYNCHITPILDIDAPAGLLIKIQTDNFDYMGLNVASVRAEYVTGDGQQEYESLGWMNGHVVKYWIPEGVKINSLKYRETGFGCDFTGFFKCNDEFFNKLWQKADRTLYVTMRDTYMDCPDRERAQWWGDMVNESGEAFYALSPSAASITQKGIMELMNWQRKDGTIYAPVPEGNWDKELPCQMLASIGYYGFWNYFMNTGDKETIAKVYKSVRRYLDVWKLKPNGILVERKGDWYWGDWGEKIDKQLIFNAWYFLALKGYQNMSLLLNDDSEAKRIQKEMDEFKSSFNSVFWDGNGYRTKEYEGNYDDRAQALAVVSGLTEAGKYGKMLEIFKSSNLASPYMEKYVLEALFVMGEAEFGLERMKKRFYKMVEESPFTTLFENFVTRNLYDGTGFIGYGSNNHAWSGGGLTILSQYVCGLEPIEPAWKTFKVKPQPGNLNFAEAGNETVAGKISVRIEKRNSEMEINVHVPENTHAVVCIPAEYKSIKLNGNQIYNRKPISNKIVDYNGEEQKFNTFKIGSGEFNFSAK